MKMILHRRPSASMVVAMTALVVASTGTAIAAGLANGDKLITKHSLSGNRLRNNTITGTQVNLNKLGKVLSATNADHATIALLAASATNAATLDGQAPSTFEPASHFIRTGLVKTPPGQIVTLATFGAFTLTLKCTAAAGGASAAEIDAISTVANSDGYGIQMANAGTAYPVVGPLTSSGLFSESNSNAADFLTPTGQAYIADLTVGQNYLGSGGFVPGCFANALVSPS
jgi:hypothetical protein